MPDRQAGRQSYSYNLYDANLGKHELHWIKARLQYFNSWKLTEYVCPLTMGVLVGSPRMLISFAASTMWSYHMVFFVILASTTEKTWPKISSFDFQTCLFNKMMRYASCNCSLLRGHIMCIIATAYLKRSCWINFIFQKKIHLFPSLQK